MFEVRALLDETAKTTARDLVAVAGYPTNLPDGPELRRDRNGHRVRRYRWGVSSFVKAVGIRESVETLDGVSATVREV